ncbi:hypothetical protein LTR84_012293 [Exophiala bonariae]|uniref:Nuclear pore complex component n=1 Tax=Exophiala bonariae TaxID=1690606 RepID=A0AAV9NG84_9EURO|nr:hypothetical protein LTR84_012293 [Exophiala bonariae]
MSSTKSQVVQTTESVVLTSTDRRPLDPSRPKTPVLRKDHTTPSPSPGTFRHPRMTEIVRRQAATTLTPERVRIAVWNMAILALSLVLSYPIHACIDLGVALCFSKNSGWSSGSLTFLRVLLQLFRGLLLLNAILALRPALPYIAKTDNCEDIPLTPTQRALLGLPPSTKATPASAGSNTGYITPPKYRRVSGSMFSGPTSGGATTGRRSASANYSDSPLSISRNKPGFSPTPESNRRTSDSPFAPSPVASPLFHKATNQASQQFSDLDFSASTQSFGLSTGTGLARSQSLRERSKKTSFGPASPTPGAGSPQMVPGVNYKWLYAKGRTLPKSESFGSFGL